VAITVITKLQGITKKPIGTNKQSALVIVQSEDKSIRTSETIELIAQEGGLFKGTVQLQKMNLLFKYRFAIKVQNHLQVIVCDSKPVLNAGNSVFSCDKPSLSFVKGENIIDMEGITIRAGDISPQNGVSDSYDATFIRNNLGSTNTEELKKGDLNLDGIIDSQDFVLVMQALDQRLDQNIE